MGYKINKKKIKEAILGNNKTGNEKLNSCNGNYSLIAQRCGVVRSTITLYFKSHPDLKKLADNEREKIVDLAEAKLPQRISEGSDTLIWKVLSTKGKERGYGEKTELEHSGQINTNKPSANELKELYEECKDGESNQEGNTD